MESFKLFIKNSSNLVLPKKSELIATESIIRFENNSIYFEASLGPSNYASNDTIFVFVLGNVSGLETNDHYSTTPATKILERYLSRDGISLETLTGHFIIGIIDSEKNQTILLNDKFSTRPIYYHASNESGSAPYKGVSKSEHFIASSKLGDLLSLLPSKPTLNHQAIFNYIYFHCIPSPDTIFSNIYKLEPSRKVSLLSDRLTIDRYWSPDYPQTFVGSKDELAKELRSSLDNELSLYRDRSDVGAFLSGGLDSSSVAAFLSKNNRLPAKTFTIGFSEPGYDESEFAAIVARKFNTEHHVRYVTPEDIYQYLPKIADYYDEPFGNSSALPAYFCAREAHERGITTLLAGDGGDELYAGNERYAKQKLYRYYENLPALLQSFLDFTVKGLNTLKFPLANKAHSYIYQAKQTTPERLQFYNFLHQNNPVNVFNADFIKQVHQELPLSRYQSRYDEVNCSLVDRMLYLDWKFTLADNDLVKVNNMTEMAGVQVKYPLLCEGLLSNSIRVPAEMKLPGNKLRDFYKYALCEVLPEETINKSKHGFGLPFGNWLTKDQKLKDLSMDALNNLKKRSFFDNSFISKAQNLHGQVHASYYGELVWIMMMLELWLDSHESRFN